jgi:hypothetical protein
MSNANLEAISTPHKEAQASKSTALDPITCLAK